ncbi:glycosyltransferase family 4 protein [Spirosoma aerophilum]
MNQDLYTLASLLFGFAVAFLSCFLLLPLLIRLSPALGLVDKPNSRKVHHQLIPAIGGLTMALALVATTLVYPPLQVLFRQYTTLTLALLVLSVTGVVDDRLNMPALVRLLIQVGCAFAVAQHGIRLSSLHGVFGITDIPLFFQYGLTVLILTGMANAFNLIDGIDGLAGSLALVNCLLLSFLLVFIWQEQWLCLLLPLTGALLAFLKFNWRPARLFMGDGGSVALGFLIAAVGIVLVEQTYQQSLFRPYAPQIVVLVMASCMIPIMDALRVFGTRISKGASPFSADKNHMHHWLLKHRFAHSQITLRIAGAHVCLIGLSLGASLIWSISTILFLQAAFIVAYTAMVQLSYSFLKSYRLIKKMEVR